MSVISAKGLRKHYGDTVALDGFDLDVGAGRIVGSIGPNGSGKTTTTAKLAHLFKEDGKKILMGACDTFRAAANEQIKVWSDRLNIDLVSSHHGADAAAVAFDSYEADI